jgi:integrase
MASSKRSDGEGSIYYDASRERYVGSYVTGWRDGKPIRKKVSGKSKADAARKLRELREKVTAGELPKGRTPTVSEWMTYWLEQIAAKKVRPSTLKGYTTCVNRYIIPLLGQHRLDRLTPEHIADAWQHLQEIGAPDVDDPHPLSSTTAHQCHRILSRALKVAQQRGHATKNVATLLDAPTPREEEIVPLSKEQAIAIMNAAADRRNGARWRVALAMGLRQGEALGLTWEHVDLEAGTLAVRQSLSRVKGKGLVFGPVKSRAGKRTLVLPPKLLAELKAHRQRQNAERLAARDWYDDADLVFAREDGRPIDPKIDWREWKALCKEVGAPDARLHDARHTAATMLLAMGVSMRVAMEILGHSRITVTQRYQHVVDEMHQDAADKMAAFWEA